MKRAARATYDESASDPIDDTEYDQAAADAVTGPVDDDQSINEKAAKAYAESPAQPQDEAIPVAQLEPDWKPASCLNCGGGRTDIVELVEAGVFKCKDCGHEWTLAEEQAPFRRLARR